MYFIGWTAIVLEVILLLIWVYSIYFQRNGTDPAGKGLAMVFIIGLAVYIVVSILLLLLHRNWSIFLAVVMAVLPLVIVVIGMVKKYG